MDIFSIQIVLDETHRDEAAGIIGSTAHRWHTYNFATQEAAQVLLDKLLKAAYDMNYVAEDD